MDPFTIAALVAMVAGAGVQYKASTDAQKRQQNEIRTGLASQRELQLKAEKKALDTAETFQAPKRAEEQGQIADELTRELMAPVSESQNIRAAQQTTQGDVSNEYSTAKAASDVNAMKTAQSLAKLLGKSSSANRLRMNEGIRVLDAGQDIDRLGGFSRGQQGADNVAIRQAGQLDPGMVLAGSLLQTAGSAGLMYGGSTGGTSPYSLSTGAPNTGIAASTGSGTQLFQPTGGMGLNMTGASSGFKMPAGLRILG